ncbi:nibrin-like [Corticium candelabrum]|uniref:nibrin-like n=1 Tax=Corticium candelabrum TaxID=121492 RepID=UPI002E2743F4|nr:nibrin-like [Corticium candelabrum]
MWTLTQIQGTGVRQIYLLSGKEYRVGRKDCDVLLEDKSVSRFHAVLNVVSSTQSQNSHNANTNVSLTDKGSKFGTKVNDRQLAANETVAIHNGDVVMFGMQGSFKVGFEQLVFCCSGMLVEEKRALKPIVNKLGGRISNDWTSDCTHLVMNSITVTIKVVAALVTCKPIIIPRWLEQACTCVEQNDPLPDPSQYLPTLAEESLQNTKISFLPDERRQKLLCGKTVILLTKKMFERLQLTIINAGGRSQLLNYNTKASDMCKLIDHDTIVLSVDLPQNCAPQEKEWVMRATKFIQKNQRRLIQESQLGLAILHVSLENFCNPFSKCQQSSQTSVTCTQTQSLSMAGPDHSTNERPLQRSNVDNSLVVQDDSSFSQQNPSKRHCGDKNTRQKQSIADCLTGGNVGSNIPYCTSFWAFPRQVPDIFPEPLLITNSSKEAIPTTCASETATTATVAVTNGSEREQESVEEPDMKPERQCLISDSSMFADLPSGQQIKYTRQTAATLHGQMRSSFSCIIYKDRDLPSNITKTEFRDLSFVAPQRESFASSRDSYGFDTSGVINVKIFRKAFMIDEKASQAVYPNQFYVHENKAKEEWRKETLAKIAEEDAKTRLEYEEEGEEEKNLFKW